MIMGFSFTTDSEPSINKASTLFSKTQARSDLFSEAGKVGPGLLGPAPLHNNEGPWHVVDAPFINMARHAHALFHGDGN
ncbi:hypothetical protein DKX38_027558 [Salix brachista]|uniref:Uncharacterized protein n=1 Tax=Salix brachista TaxID=2182728 RepID=A0A5N5J4Q0_9ROSI|nr:hypothetical protein DKX38_027558 [Salix brachista]